MTEAQSRVPRGVPDGGQWAATERGEAHLDLTPLDGSLLYPPIFTNAEQIIDFWSRVEVSDEVLHRAERVYRDVYAEVSQTWPAVAWKRYGQADWADDNPAPDPSDVGATADWEGRKRAAQVDYEDALSEVVSRRPERLDRRDVRPLVRATAMLRAATAALNSGVLDLDGYHQVTAHDVVLTTGPTTVQAAAIETGYAGVARRFLDADQYDLDGIPRDEMRQIVREEMNQANHDQNVKMDRVFDELTDNLGTVEETILDVADPKGARRRRRRD